MLSVIQKFPEVMHVINRICKRWIMRRCFVRAAEPASWAGDQFRGRLRPIYARRAGNSGRKQSQQQSRDRR